MTSRTREPSGSRRIARATVALCAALAPVTAGCGADDTAAALPSTSVAVTTTSVPVRTTATQTSASPIGQPTVDPYAGLPLIDHVEWTSNVDGPRLLVFPTVAGRRTTEPGADERAWQEVLADDGDAGTPGMRDQFVCHWEWARLVQPNKPSWNLEPWRPDVGYQATVAASCNPGGPER